MKRILAMILAAMMMFTCVACGNSGGNETSNESIVTVASADELLNEVWAGFADDEKFAAMGGDASNMVDGEAGIFNIEDTESLNAMLHIPAELVEDIDEAASLIHAMNANTFTGAAYHLKDGVDAESFVTSLKEGILSTQWMCGFPEKLSIYTVGDYVVAAFGNGEIMDNFNSKLVEIYGDNAVASVDESIQ